MSRRRKSGWVLDLQVQQQLTTAVCACRDVVLPCCSVAALERVDITILVHGGCSMCRPEEVQRVAAVVQQHHEASEA